MGYLKGYVPTSSNPFAAVSIERIESWASPNRTFWSSTSMVERSFAPWASWISTSMLSCSARDCKCGMINQCQCGMIGYQREEERKRGAENKEEEGKEKEGRKRDTEREGERGEKRKKIQK